MADNRCRAKQLHCCGHRGGCSLIQAPEDIVRNPAGVGLGTGEVRADTDRAQPTGAAVAHRRRAAVQHRGAFPARVGPGHLHLRARAAAATRERRPLRPGCRATWHCLCCWPGLYHFLCTSFTDTSVECKHGISGLKGGWRKPGHVAQSSRMQQSIIFLQYFTRHALQR